MELQKSKSSNGLERRLNYQGKYETYGLTENPLQFIYTSGKEIDKNGTDGCRYRLHVAPASPLNASHRFDSSISNAEEFEEPFWMSFLVRYCLEALSCDPPKNSTVISNEWLEEFNILPPPEDEAVTNDASEHLEPWPQVPVPDASCDPTTVEFILIEDEKTNEVVDSKPPLARKTEIQKPNIVNCQPEAEFQPDAKFQPDAEFNLSHDKQKRGRKRKNAKDDEWISISIQSSRPSFNCSTLNGFDSNLSLEAFKENGTGTDPKTRFRLRHTPAPTVSFSCLSCPSLQVFTKLSKLSKHIESNHCSNKLMCLLCKLDDKGCCPGFRSTTEAFIHAMELHHDSRYFLCQFCQLLLSSQEALEFHLTQSHPNENLPDTPVSMRRYPCLLCLFPFRRSGHRKDHFRQNHAMNVELYFPKKEKKKIPSLEPSSKKQKKNENETSIKQEAEMFEAESSSNLLSGKKLIWSSAFQTIEKPQKEKKVKQINENGTPKTPKMKKKLKRLSDNEASDNKIFDEKEVLENKEEKKEIKIEETAGDKPGTEIGPTASSTSPPSPTNGAKRRTFLRRDLKDKFVDILQRQPSVCMINIAKDRRYKSSLKSAMKLNTGKTITINLKDCR